MTNHDEAPSERWRRVERVYLSALGRKDEERSAVLDDLCRSDDTLRREVESFEVGAHPVHAPLPMPLSRLSPD